jgi:hypothetical protein
MSVYAISSREAIKDLRKPIERTDNSSQKEFSRLCCGGRNCFFNKFARLLCMEDLGRQTSSSPPPYSVRRDSD